jgi:oligoribonuclease
MLKFVSIDVETTGLDPNTCQIIQFGAVIADLETPIDLLPKMEVLIDHDNQIFGEPYALWMNGHLLKRINDKQNLVQANALRDTFFAFLDAAGYDLSKKILAAGKNFAAFDLQFLLKYGFTKDTFKHRFLDPAMLFMKQEDETPPDLKTCLTRAALDDCVSHHALDDAIKVVQLIRAGLK